MENLNKSSSLLFATFSPYFEGKRDPKNGNVEAFISFFSKRISKFVIIDQPHTGSDIVESIIEEYKDGKFKKKYSLNNFFYKPFYFLLKSFKTTDDDTSIFYKLRDIVSVIHVGLSSKMKFEYFVGLESANALAGIILRKMGRVEKVIYYVSDYSPIRYDNKIFNYIYLALDRYCCYNSDFIWDVSKAMHPARVKAGLNREKSAPVIHVPNALFPKYIKHLPIDKIIPFSLVFMGSLGFENGPDLAIEALPIVIDKFPKTILHIIGGREKELLRLKKLTESLRLKQYVKFYGIIPDDEAMLTLLRQFYLGLAPYVKLKNSVRLYGDSLKLRAYMACGIPVVTTSVPPLGRELESFGSAIIAKDNKKDIASSIIKFFSDEKFYKEYKKRAIDYGKNNTWENTFIRAFERMKNDKS